MIFKRFWGEFFFFGFSTWGKFTLRKMKKMKKKIFKKFSKTCFLKKFSKAKFPHVKNPQKNFFASKSLKNYIKMILKQKKKIFFSGKIFFRSWHFWVFFFSPEIPKLTAKTTQNSPKSPKIARNRPKSGNWFVMLPPNPSLSNARIYFFGYFWGLSRLFEHFKYFSRFVYPNAAS